MCMCMWLFVYVCMYMNAVYAEVRQTHRQCNWSYNNHCYPLVINGRHWTQVLWRSTKHS